LIYVKGVGTSDVVFQVLPDFLATIGVRVEWHG